MDVTARLGDQTLQIGDIVSTDLDHLDLALTLSARHRLNVSIFSMGWIWCEPFARGMIKPR